MKRLFFVFLTLGMLVSAACHVWEYRKIREFSRTFQAQSEIELKRTALMVIYQQILRNTVREIDELKHEKAERDRKNFSELFKEETEVQP